MDSTPAPENLYRSTGRRGVSAAGLFCATKPGSDTRVSPRALQGPTSTSASARFVAARVIAEMDCGMVNQRRLGGRFVFVEHDETGIVTPPLGVSVSPRMSVAPVSSRPYHPRSRRSAIL
jgi:hypothetical protein